MIMVRALACALLLSGTTLHAQEAVSSGSGAELRALDKLTARTDDFVLANGASTSFGRITVALRECRYPEGNPAGDAFAFVTVTEVGRDAPVFEGWLVASSPALNALEHARYDVWALRCTTS